MPMIEKLILDYLTEELDVPVYPEKPLEPPETYVLFERTGSSERNHVRSATVAIQAYAPSMYQAAQLSSTVCDVMRNFITEPEISHCGLNSEYNFTDTTKKGYRYQSVWDIVYMED